MICLNGQRFGQLAACVMAIFAAVDAVGVEFHVDSSVFVEGHPEPIARTTTYFRESRIYDVRLQPSRQVVILQREPPAMTLLDYERRVVCDVSGDDVMRTVAALAARAADKPPAVRFAAEPTFKANWNSKHELQMRAQPMNYHVVSQAPELPEAASRYREFADWTARLNATRTGGMPPFARMAVNRELATNKQVPTRVTYTQRNPSLTLYSTHAYAWRLSDEQRHVIRTIEQDRLKFDSIDLIAFRVPGESSSNR